MDSPLAVSSLTGPASAGLSLWIYLPIWAFDGTLTSLGRALGCVIVAVTAEPIATARLMGRKEIHMCAIPIVKVRD